MTILDNLKEWGGWVAGALVAAGLLWRQIGFDKHLQYFKLQLDGFKLEYDKLNRSDANKEGQLQGRDYTRTHMEDRADHEREKAP